MAFIERYEKEQKERGLFDGIHLTGEAHKKVVDDNNEIMNIQKKDNKEPVEKPLPNEKPLIQEFKEYKYANFLIPLYKFPSVQILTIFLPLVLLSIINLGIFFQDYDLHDRIASISVLLIAFVALVPTLRE